MAKIVMVRFEDLCHSAGWTPINEIPIKADLLCTAVGFLIKEEEDMITIAQAVGICDCDDVLNPFTIPRGNIKEMKVINDGDVHT